MTAPEIAYEAHDVEDAKTALDELVACYLDVYSETDDSFFGEDRYRRQLAGHLTAPGWEAVMARSPSAGGELVGYVYGFTLAATTRWWDGLTEPDDAFASETGDRTVVISEIMVRKPWRRQGVARQLHDHFLARRPERRATLLVEPDNTAANTAYAAWGWRKVNQLLPGWEGAPLYDVLVLDRPWTDGGR